MAQRDEARADHVTILGRDRRYDGFVKLDLYDVEIVQGGRSARVRREVHDHGQGAAVLPYDPERRTALLVRQHRLPVAVAEADDHDGFLLEACAGLIDPQDADAAAAIVREAREELGTRVHDLEPVARVYTCPGVITETIACFLARYAPSDRIEDGGGVDADELIEVDEWTLAALAGACAAGRIHDAKTVLLIQALQLRRPDLFR